MNGSEIKTFFENLIDDTLDSDFTYDLMANAKDQVEAERDWEMLKKKDSDTKTTTGYTYANAISLPTDFLLPRKIVIGTLEWKPIPFERQIEFKDYGQRYFIDHANNELHLCGTIAESKTIHNFYIYKTDDIAAATSPVWPAKFHKLIAFRMARLVGAGIDADDLSFRMSPEQERQARVLEDAMISWNSRIQLSSMGGATEPEGIDLDRDDVV